MRLRLKHVLVALVAFLSLAFAYSPLLRAGLVASDYAALIEGRPLSDEAFVAEDGGAWAPKPLARASYALSRSAWGMPAVDGGRAVAVALRVENLVLLVVAAVGLGAFLRRLLLPWTGNDPALGAARAAGFLLILHPLAVCAVGDVGSRGDLLGCGLAAWCAAAFLRGRQDRRTGAMAVALLLAVAAGSSSDVALGLAPVLMVSEFVSSHRYRSPRLRLRTGVTTLLVFGAAASVDLAIALIRRGADGAPPVLRALLEVTSLEGARVELIQAIEKLGVLVLPSNPEVFDVAGIALAGAVFLLAMQPALLAARSAPRLWGWLLIGWIGALIASATLHVHVSVLPGEFWRTAALLPSVVVMAGGLGLASTAMSGPERPYVAWVVAIGSAALAHGNARPFEPAGREAARLRLDLQTAREQLGELDTLVLDPPLAEAGVEPVGRALPYLDHPALRSQPAVEPPAASRELRGISLGGFLALVGEPEFRALADGGLTVLFPAAALLGEDEAPGEGAVAGRRAYRRLSLPAPSSGPRAWSRTVSSPPDVDAAALIESALRVTTPADVDPAELARLSWIPRGKREPDLATIEGVWTRTGDEHVGIFDLGGSLAWRLSGRVRRLLFERGTSLGRAEILSSLPGLGPVEPRVDGSDWVFERPSLAPPGGLPDGGTFRLGVLELHTLAWREFELSRDPADSNRLRATDVVPYVETSAPSGPEIADEHWAWLLDYRIDGRAAARVRGRF